MTGETVLSIKVDSAQAVQSIAEYSRKIEQLRKVEADLQKTIKEEGDSTGKLRRKLIEFSEERKTYTRIVQEQSKEVQNNIKVQTKQNGSLNQLRAQLSNLTKQYDELSRAERESAKGSELKNKINAITDELKGSEEATQRYYRNVGNYEGALRNMFGATAAGAGQSVAGIKNMITASGGVIPAFKAMSKAASTALGPIGIIVMAVVAVFKLFQSAINGSEESSDKAGEAFSFLRIIFDRLTQGVEIVAKVFIGFVSVIGKVINAITGAESATNRYNEAIKEQNRLKRESRALDEQSADVELELAKLREKATDKINYSAKQRLAFLKEANEKERKLSEDKFKLAKREYENIKELNSLTQSSQEDNEKLSQAYIKMRNAETEYFKKKKELNAQMAEATNQMIADAKALADAQKAIREQELKDIEATLDAMLDLYEDGQIKEVALENERYRRQRASLEKRLREEKSLTVAQRALLHKQIELLTSKHEKNISNIKKKYAEESARERADIEHRIFEQEISLMEDGFEKDYDAATLKHDRNMRELKAEFAAISAAAQSEISNWRMQIKEVEGSQNEDNAIKKRIAEIEDELSQKRSAYAKLEDIEKERYEKEKGAASQRERIREKELTQENQKLIEEQNLLSQELAIAKMRDTQGEEAALRQELVYKANYLSELQNMEESSWKSRYESELHWQKAIYDAQKEYDAKAEALAQLRWERIATEADRYSGIGDVLGSLSGIVEQYSEENRAAAIASKTLAIGEIAVQTGVAIAKGVASAAAVPFPGNIASILATVATVLANIASATSIVKSAKFATGGYVSGAGTGTSDSIPAMLSNGESVNNARATSMFAPLYSSLNQMGGGVPIVATQTASQVQGEDMLARAFAKGMSEADIRVGVDEITRVQNRVKVVENLGVL